MHSAWTIDFFWVYLTKFLNGHGATIVTQVCKSAVSRKIMIWRYLIENFYPDHQLPEGSALSTLIGAQFLFQISIERYAIKRLNREEVLEIHRLRPNAERDERLRRGMMKHCKVIAIVYGISPGTIRKIW